MRILGIDYGDARIGVAISDPLGMIANGLDTVSSKNSFKNALYEIADLCREYEVKTAVVGYPKNMDGTLGERVERTEGFIRALQEVCPEIEIIRWDERLSSAEAHKTMKAFGINTRKHGKGVVDKIAAEIILQGYLDRYYRK